MAIYEFLGHEIEFYTNDEENNAGNKNLKASKKEEKVTRDRELLNTKKISDIEANNITKMGSHANNENKRKLRSHGLRKLYRVSEVTQDLIDFDEANFQAIQLLLLAESDNKLTVDMQFKKQMIQRFIETVGLHDEEFRCNTSDAREFNSFLYTELNVGIQTRKAYDVFNDVFTYSTISKSSAMATLTSVLENEFNIEPVEAKNKDRQRAKTANLSAETKMWLEHIRSESTYLLAA